MLYLYGAIPHSIVLMPMVRSTPVRFTVFTRVGRFDDPALVTFTLQVAWRPRLISVGGGSDSSNVRQVRRLTQKSRDLEDYTVR
jgi:hypothetical protein